MDWIQAVNEAVVKGGKKEIRQLTIEALNNGVEAQNLVNKAILPAMNIVSKLWRREEYYIPEVMRAAATMQEAMYALRPLLVGDVTGKGVKVAIGTVKGDRHYIGKNLVGMMLEGVGYEIEDLGADSPAEKFLEAARNGARVIGMSSLLTTTMPEMINVITLIKKNGLRERVTIIIGGAPVTAAYAESIGADYYAADAAEVVDILNSRFD